MIKQTENLQIQKIHTQRIKKWFYILFLFVAIILILGFTMLMLGNTIYPIKTVLRVLAGAEVNGATFAIEVLKKPRMLAAIFSGFAFGIAGNTFQTMLRNPLASPDIIGISSSTSLAAVFCMLVLNLSGALVSIISVCFGLFISILIYFLSSGGRFNGGRLILIGIGIQAMIQASISYLLLSANQYDVPAAMRWLSGNLNGMQMKDIPLLATVSLVCSVGILFLSKQLQILELGEEMALTLGVKTKQTRILLIVCSVILVAFSTAVTGPISFVAFLSGPIAKRIFSKIKNVSIPAGLTGSILVMASDLVGQYLLPVKYPVGIIAGILGAPYLIYLLIRINKQGGIS